MFKKIFTLSLALLPLSLISTPAQAMPGDIRNYCGTIEHSRATLDLFAETKNFYLNICRGENREFIYISEDKNSGAKSYIVATNDNPGVFFAPSRRLNYILDINQKVLKIYKGRRMIQQQRIIRFD